MYTKLQKTEGKLAIGVDSNQNHVQPGTMLTSMVKRVDQAAYKTYKDAAAGTWKPGLVVSVCLMVVSIGR